MYKNIQHKFAACCTLLISSFILSACATNGASPVITGDGLEASLQRAAHQAESSSVSKSSLSGLQKTYTQDPKNPVKAIRYAGALRKAGEYTDAAAVLRPLVNDPKSPATIKREYAALQLDMGNYTSAVRYAQSAVQQNPADAQTYQILGIAQDAKGDYPQAEKSFRKALDIWQGDKIPLMNNLALNLANQDKVDEAIALLREAKAMAPGRKEIERNLRIISTLNEKVNYDELRKRGG